MNQKEEKWEPEYDRRFQADEFGVIQARGESIKDYIRKNFIYKPDLIALVEGLMLERICYIGEELPQTKDPRSKFVLLGYPAEFLAALKDTLSNKE